MFIWYVGRALLRGLKSNIHDKHGNLEQSGIVNSVKHSHILLKTWLARAEMETNALKFLFYDPRFSL